MCLWFAVKARCVSRGLDGVSGGWLASPAGKDVKLTGFLDWGFLSLCRVNLNVSAKVCWCCFGVRLLVFLLGRGFFLLRRVLCVCASCFLGCSSEGCLFWVL